MKFDFFLAYVLTIAIETVILFLILRKRYGAKTIIANSLVASTVTLPFVWFFFPLLVSGYWNALATSELFAFATEAGICKKLFENLEWKEAIVSSFLCNATTFLIGLILIQ